MDLYCVINMDIVGSRKVRNRELLQHNLKTYIDIINDKYAGILAAPVTITLGDEWQAATSKPSEAYNIVHDFQQLLWQDGLDIYAGIGIGNLSTPISQDVRMMDGSCFHAARDAINLIKCSHQSKKKTDIHKLNKVYLLSASMSSGIQLGGIKGPSIHPVKQAMDEAAAIKETNYKDLGIVSIHLDLFERSINMLIENNEVLKAKMTPKQREAYVDYIRLGSYRKMVDHYEDKTETISGISQKLNNASFFTIQKNHRLVSDLLDAYSGRGV